MDDYFGNLNGQHLGMVRISHAAMRILIIEKVNLNMPVGIIHRTHQICRVGKRQREQLRHPKWTATGDQDAHKEVQVELVNWSNMLLIYF